MANSSKGTLKYRKVQRTPQSGENAGKKKWYAAAVSDREVDFESFVTHIAEHGSPFSRGTVHGVMLDSLDCLQELILDGKSVRLGELGLFSIGMTSKAEDSRDKVTAQSVEGVHLILRNTKTWSNAELRKKCRIEEYDSYNSDEGSTPSDGGNKGGTTDGNKGGSDSTGDNTGSGSKGDNSGSSSDGGDVSME